MKQKQQKYQEKELNDIELKPYRTLVSQLLWAVNETRPDIQFDICELSSTVKYATVSDMLCANKVLKT